MSGGSNIRDAVKRAVAARGRGDWSFLPPKGWEHEVEETLDTFFDPDGVGALQFSSVTKSSGDVTDADLIENIEDMNLAGLPRTAVTHGAFSGYKLRKEHDDGQVGEYWFLRARNALLFATYFCAKEDVGREAGVVKKALDSLRLT
jgi:hypothetical protein